MTPKLTSKPVEDDPIDSHIIIYGIHELEKTLRSTLYATLGKQGFALMPLLVYMVDPSEPISIPPPFLVRIPFSVSGIPSPHRGCTHHPRTVVVNSSDIGSSSRSRLNMGGTSRSRVYSGTKLTLGVNSRSYMHGLS